MAGETKRHDKDQGVVGHLSAVKQQPPDFVFRSKVAAEARQTIVSRFLKVWSYRKGVHFHADTNFLKDGQRISCSPATRCATAPHAPVYSFPYPPSIQSAALTVRVCCIAGMSSATRTGSRVQRYDMASRATGLYTP